MAEKKTEMPSFSQSTRDSALFESYGRFISRTYPLFLRKLGINRVAIKAEGATITDTEGKTYIEWDMRNRQHLPQKPFMSPPYWNSDEVNESF